MPLLGIIVERQLMRHFLSVLITDGRPADSEAMGAAYGTSGYSELYSELTSLIIG